MSEKKNRSKTQIKHTMLHFPYPLLSGSAVPRSRLALISAATPPNAFPILALKEALNELIASESSGARRTRARAPALPRASQATERAESD